MSVCITGATCSLPAPPWSVFTRRRPFLSSSLSFSASPRQEHGLACPIFLSEWAITEWGLVEQPRRGSTLQLLGRQRTATHGTCGVTHTNQHKLRFGPISNYNSINLITKDEKELQINTTTNTRMFKMLRNNLNSFNLILLTILDPEICC